MLLPLSVWGQHNGVLGGRLRDEAQKASKDIPAISVVFDFVERYLAELQGMNATEQSSRMERDDVRITKGRIENLARIDDSSSLAFAEENNRYSLAVFNAKSPIIEISFPASCQLMTGQNLKQLEDNLFVGLDNYSYRIVDTLTTEISELKPLHDNYYMKPGGAYQIDDINSNLYLINSDGGLQLVFDADHPLESCHNLLLSELSPGEVSLELVVRKYGLKKEQRTLPLKLWLSYLKVLGCNIYIGIEEMGTNSIRVAFFAVNNIFKYNHVMNVEVPYTVFKDRKGTVTGDLNLFVPTHNISALFDELNEASDDK